MKNHIHIIAIIPFLSLSLHAMEEIPKKPIPTRGTSPTYDTSSSSPPAPSSLEMEVAEQNHRDALEKLLVQARKSGAKDQRQIITIDFRRHLKFYLQNIKEKITISGDACAEKMDNCAAKMEERFASLDSKLNSLHKKTETAQNHLAAVKLQLTEERVANTLASFSGNSSSSTAEQMELESTREAAASEKEHAIDRLFNAIENGDEQTGQDIISDYPDSIHQRNESGQTPLFVAALQGNLAIARTLILTQSDVSARDNKLSSPLHAAVKGASLAGQLFRSADQHIEIIKLLLQHDATPDLRDHKGQTVKDLAQKLGQAKLVRNYFESRSTSPHREQNDISQNTDTGKGFEEESDIEKTIEEKFFYAAHEGDLDKLKYCLAAGVEVDTLNPKTGESALHIALWNKHEHIATYLLEQGINTQHRSHKGKSALEIADWIRSSKHIKRLLQSAPSTILERTKRNTTSRTNTNPTVQPEIYDFSSIEEEEEPEATNIDGVWFFATREQPKNISNPFFAPETSTDNTYEIPISKHRRKPTQPKKATQKSNGVHKKQHKKKRSVIETEDLTDRTILKMVLERSKRDQHKKIR